MTGSSGKILITLGTILFLGAFFAGCGSSPRERYRVLSMFFDGVPDPDAPVHKAAGPAATQKAGGTVVLATVISRHKPFTDNQCDSCHRSDTGNLMDFDDAYKLCGKCHKDVPTAKPRMHGPVALSACRWCHSPHESTEPHLFKDNDIKVCSQCHVKELLGATPPEHLDGKTSCLSCHFGHGGTDRYFIKPVSAAVPATGPATSRPAAPQPLRQLSLPDDPSTQPADTPATLPATLPPGPPATGGGP